MSSPLRILVVAYSVPPSTDVGGDRVVRFCKYLPEFGIQPVVLTVQDRFRKQLDHKFSVAPAIPVIRTTQHDTPLEWYASWKSRRSNSSEPLKGEAEPKTQEFNTALPRRWRQHLISALSIPDKYWGWYFPARREGAGLLQSAKFDAILSTSPPATAHLVGLSLKKKYRIPWIVDFRDPWATNELQLSSPLKWRRQLDKRMEASCVTSADLVVCNTDSLHKILCDRYRKLPQSKFLTLTNGFDDLEAHYDTDLKKHKPMRCLHLGDIYGSRRIDNFCAALSFLVKSKQLDHDTVEVVFVGDTDESQIAACRKVSSDLMDSGMIQFHQRVDKKQARDLLWTADLLLIFQGGYRSQIPLKFYEYLSTGKPIFAVAQQGALSDVMLQTGVGICVGEGDPLEIGQKFLGALALPAQPAKAIQGRFAERFHFRSLSFRLANWIRCVVDGQKCDPAP